MTRQVPSIDDGLEVIADNVHIWRFHNQAMPELGEVNHVALLLREVALDRVIEEVITSDDTIVYNGITHEDFAQEIKGRKVRNVGRYGKVFYLELEGEGKHPVMHLGMTGSVYVRGTNPFIYKSGSRKTESTDWPPRFMKFIIKFSSMDDSPPKEVVFVDARRLGRIRLCGDPLKEPPISKLGFDPILCMPEIEEFTPMVRKRTSPIKSLLLDQHTFAGVGNWIADEVLFHSRIHPEQKANTLTDEQVLALHEKTIYVCQTAVDANADSSKFPNSWLFHHRWGKGKKSSSDLILPSGEKALIKWITVGARTSAYVPKVQILSQAAKSEAKAKARGKQKTTVKPAKTIVKDEDVEDSSSLSDLTDEDDLPIPPQKVSAAKTKKEPTKTKAPITQTTSSRVQKRALDTEPDEPKPKRRRSGRTAPTSS